LAHRLIPAQCSALLHLVSFTPIPPLSNYRFLNYQIIASSIIKLSLGRFNDFYKLSRRSVPTPQTSHSLLLQQTNPEGCQACFCFGHTDQCEADTNFTPKRVVSDFERRDEGWMYKVRYCISSFLLLTVKLVVCPSLPPFR
jgi:hypothetical protein